MYRALFAPEYRNVPGSLCAGISKRNRLSLRRNIETYWALFALEYRNVPGSLCAGISKRNRLSLRRNIETYRALFAPEYRNATGSLCAEIMKPQSESCHRPNAEILNVWDLNYLRAPQHFQGMVLAQRHNLSNSLSTKIQWIIRPCFSCV